jgi:hypothetical protein
MAISAMAGASETSAGRAVGLAGIFSASSHPAQNWASSASVILISTKEPSMSSLHSLLDNAITAGSIYGWRLDAILLGSILWALATSYTQLRIAIA